MLANECCKNEKLEGEIEKLEMENSTLKKDDRKQNKSEVTEKSHVSEPRARPKATIEEKQQNELEDALRLNYQLKAELISLKEKTKSYR